MGQSPFPFDWRRGEEYFFEVRRFLPKLPFDVLQWPRAVRTATETLANSILLVHYDFCAYGTDHSDRVAWSDLPGASVIASIVEDTLRSRHYTLGDVGTAITGACFARLDRAFLDTDEIPDLLFAAHCVGEDLWHRDRGRAGRLVVENAT